MIDRYTSFLTWAGKYTRGNCNSRSRCYKNYRSRPKVVEKKVRKMSRHSTDQHKTDHSSNFPRQDVGVSLIASVVRMKCPSCRKGRLFTSKNPYVFKNSLKMPPRCPVCEQDFQIEPGFYIGALWTSFPIVIVTIAALSALLLIILKMQLEWFFVVLTLILLLLQPVIIRLGRSIWIHIFVRFEQLGQD